MDELALKLVESSLSAFVTVVVMIVAFRPLIKTIADRDTALAERERNESVNQRAELQLFTSLATTNQDVTREAVSTIRAVNNTLQNNTSILHTMHAQQLANTTFIARMPEILKGQGDLFNELSDVRKHIENRFNSTDGVLKDNFEAIRGGLANLLLQIDMALSNMKDAKDETTAPEPDSTPTPAGLESPERANVSAVVEP
jgi:hypothetical protein